MAVKSPTIDDLIREADTSAGEKWGTGRGCVLSPGVRRLLELTDREGCGLWWLFVDITAHCQNTSAGHCTLEDIAEFPHLPKLNEAWAKYGEQYESFLSTWTLKKWGKNGARLCIHEALTESGEDRSLEHVPVQDYPNVNMPWGESGQVSFYVSRPPKSWAWFIYLRSEY